MCLKLSGRKKCPEKGGVWLIFYAPICTEADLKSVFELDMNQDESHNNKMTRAIEQKHKPGFIAVIPSFRSAPTCVWDSFQGENPHFVSGRVDEEER